MRAKERPSDEYPQRVSFPPELLAWLLASPPPLMVRITPHEATPLSHGFVGEERPGFGGWKLPGLSQVFCESPQSFLASLEGPGLLLLFQLA